MWTLKSGYSFLVINYIQKTNILLGRDQCHLQLIKNLAGPLQLYGSSAPKPSCLCLPMAHVFIKIA